MAQDFMVYESDSRSAAAGTVRWRRVASGGIEGPRETRASGERRAAADCAGAAAARALLIHTEPHARIHYSALLTFTVKKNSIYCFSYGDGLCSTDRRRTVG